MTDSSEFEEAFVAFRSMPYPAYPRLADLQDWNSRLLTLDSHIAGYASRVYSGHLKARDVPNLDSLVFESGSLKASLEVIQPVSDQDVRLIDDYRSYAAALERLTIELAKCASRENNI